MQEIHERQFEIKPQKLPLWQEMVESRFLESENILFPLQRQLLIFVWSRSNFSTHLSDAPDVRIQSE